MTHFLDTLPFDFSLQPSQDLVAFLTDTYYLPPAAIDIARGAGMRMASIDWSQPMQHVWPEILEKARNQNKLRKLLTVIVDSADEAVAARVSEWLEAEPPTIAPQPGPTGVVWKASSGGELERQIFSEPTLLDVAFLRRGAELAAGVCRLRVTTPSDREYLGTAFRVSETLLLTNHHVLFDAADGSRPAKAVEAWFGYERTFQGQELAHLVASGDPASIQGDREHDWAVVDLGASMPPEAPITKLTPAQPVVPGDRVYIIQHPQGAPKKIGMIHNLVRYVDGDVIQYLTDTEGGSSGSPVFDEQWRIVALHHSWVAHKSAGRVEYRNQGRRIERVAEGLARTGLI